MNTHINLFQIILFFLVSFFSVRLLKKSIVSFDYVFIGLFYIIFNAILFNPNFLIVVANFFGIRRGTDIFVYSSSVMLLMAVLYLLKKIKKIEQDLTLLVGRIAIAFINQERFFKEALNEGNTDIKDMKLQNMHGEAKANGLSCLRQ